MDNPGVPIVRVRIKLLGHLRQFSPAPVLEMEIAAGSTILELIQKMTATLGQGFRQAVFDPSGDLHGGIEVVLDDEHLPARKISSIEINKDSSLFILPMIEGG